MGPGMARSWSCGLASATDKPGGHARRAPLGRSVPGAGDAGIAHMIDEPRLQIESREIEPMLAELRHEVEPSAWEHIAEVIARLVRLYGAGLERALAHARAAGAFAPRFDELVGDDAVLASLLVLHG